MSQTDEDVVDDDQENVDEPVDDSDQPDIEDDEMADFDAVADQVEAQSGVDDDQDDAGDDEGDVEEPDTADASVETSDRDITIGHVYCNGLGMLAAVGRTSYGSAERDRSDLVDEYGDLARDLQIDEYVDQWMQEQGGMDELTPGQAIIVSTLLFGGMVAMDDPAMVEGIATEVSA